MIRDRLVNYHRKKRINKFTNNIGIDLIVYTEYYIDILCQGERELILTLPYTSAVTHPVSPGLGAIISAGL